MSTVMVQRLATLLSVLTADWQQRDRLLAALASRYPPDRDSARRMFARDLSWLGTLGFCIERSEERRDPHFRLAGHERFGAEIPKKRTIIDGVEYESRTAAARALGVTNSTILNRLRRPDQDRAKRDYSHSRMKKPTIIDGVEYESQTAAARALGLTPSALNHRLRRATNKRRVD